MAVRRNPLPCRSLTLAVAATSTAAGSTERSPTTLKPTIGELGTAMPALRSTCCRRADSRPPWSRAGRRSPSTQDTYVYERGLLQGVQLL